jgi:hypothetical protein
MNWQTRRVESMGTKNAGIGRWALGACAVRALIPDRRFGCDGSTVHPKKKRGAQ